MNFPHSLFPFSGYHVKHIKVPDDPNGAVRVYLERHEKRPLLCRCCGRVMHKVRGYERAQAEDLTTVGRKTFIHFRRLKARCDGCRKTRLESCDFISKASPHLTTRLAFWLYRLCEIAPVARVAELAEQSKMTLWRVDLAQLQASFAYYDIPEVRHLTVDEVYAKAHHDEECDENRNDRFFTIITCLATHKVVWVEKSRRKAALDKFFEQLGPERCALIEVVATDQHEDYAQSIKQYCPNASHVLDRFHLMKNFEEAINETRKLLFKMLPQKEVRQLARPKFKYIFLKKADRRSDSETQHMAKVMKDNEAFFRLELIKERMLTLFDAKSSEEALKTFEEIGQWIWEAGFPQLKSWWINLSKKWSTVANYFKFRVTSALAEGVNNVIKALKRRAYGFNNLEYFKLKILQICGFLNSRHLAKKNF